VSGEPPRLDDVDDRPPEFPDSLSGHPGHSPRLPRSRPGLRYRDSQNERQRPSLADLIQEAIALAGGQAVSMAQCGELIEFHYGRSFSINELKRTLDALVASGQIETVGPGFRVIGGIDHLTRAGARRAAVPPQESEDLVEIDESRRRAIKWGAVAREQLTRSEGLKRELAESNWMLAQAKSEIERAARARTEEAVRTEERFLALESRVESLEDWRGRVRTWSRAAFSLLFAMSAGASAVAPFTFNLPRIVSVGLLLAAAILTAASLATAFDRLSTKLGGIFAIVIIILGFASGIAAFDYFLQMSGQ